MWRETQGSSRLAMGIWEYLSSGNMGVRTPLELRWGSCVSSRIAEGFWASSRVTEQTRGSSLVVAGNSVFLREFPQVTGSSSQSAVRNQCSSGFAVWDAGWPWSSGEEVGVLLELGWYSGFLVIFSGTSCRVLLGQLASSRDVQGGLCLVAVRGGCSLVMQVTTIIVVVVHSVVAGA